MTHRGHEGQDILILRRVKCFLERRGTWTLGFAMCPLGEEGLMLNTERFTSKREELEMRREKHSDYGLKRGIDEGKQAKWGFG